MKQKTPAKPLIVLFDLSSTLATVETWDLLSKHKPIPQNIKEINNNAMNGHLSSKELLQKLLPQLSVSRQDKDEIKNIALTHLSVDALRLIRKLCQLPHVRLGILSLHFQETVSEVGSLIGCDPLLCYGLRLNYDTNGQSNGYDADQLITQENGKALVVQDIKSKYPDSIVVHIGDSVTDLATQGIADMFIGYGGVEVRQKVRDKSKFFAMNFAEVEQMISRYL
jgi:phosphoserine phosphatase